MSIFEQSRYFFNYILPDIIVSNLEQITRFLNEFVWLFVFIPIALIFIIIKIFRHSVLLKTKLEKNNEFIKELGNKEEVRELLEYVLKNLPSLLKIRYISIYDLRGGTYVLIDSNIDEKNRKNVNTPFRINQKDPEKFTKSGKYSVNYYISEDLQYLFLFFSYKTVELEEYYGLFNTIAKIYKILHENHKLQSGETTANVSHDTSVSLIKLQMDKYQFFKFFVALILKITKAKGARLLTNKGEMVFEYFNQKGGKLQKIFYIRNTPYKLEFFNDSSLENSQIAQIGSFLDMAGGFLVNIDKSSEMVQNYLNLLKFTNKAIELENEYYKNHSLIVQTISTEIAKSLFLSEAEIDTISLGSYLHDIGMIGDLSVILEKSKLKEKEIDLIKEHPIIGSIMVEPISHIYPISNIIKYHHERYDGRGYPFGIKKSEIPISAQVVALSEFYTGITSDRSYRKGKTHTEAIKEITNMKNKMFNPVVVDAFLDTQKSIETKIKKILKREDYND